MLLAQREVAIIEAGKYARAGRHALTVADTVLITAANA